MKQDGTIASCGLTAGVELHTTVMPFILRGVSLLGIDSVQCPMELRRRVWERLASDMRAAPSQGNDAHHPFRTVARNLRRVVEGHGKGQGGG